MSQATGANAVSDLERAEHKGFADGVGAKRVIPYLANSDGTYSDEVMGFSATANLTITDTTDGDINTIVITDGVKTKTVTINNATDGITIVWT
jgi:hypothetical protein